MTNPPIPPLRGAFERADTKLCSHCLGEFLVRKDGMIRHHGARGRSPCPGANKPPAVMHDALGEDGWARGLIERAADG